MTILYLHGFASSPASKKAQFFSRKFAAQGVEVRVPDLAAGNFEGLTISGQLQVAEAAGNGEPVAVIGSSMGGYLAALYAARHPEATHFVGLAPSFDFSTRWLARLGEEGARQWRESGALLVYHYGEMRDARVGWQLQEDASRFEPYPLVTQPSLVFHGRRDTVVPCEVSEEFARRTPQTELHLVDSDHELLDVLEPIWEAVWQFLSR